MPKLPGKSSLHLGIDPGQSGGIVLMTSTQAILECIPMPSTERDVWQVFKMLPNISTIYAVIESVHSMPQQGVSSSFKFGRGYGFLRGCLVSRQILFEEVTPQKWQKTLGVIPRKKTESKSQFKTRLLSKAQQMFPDLSLWDIPRSKGLQLSICDALLIAEYSRRQS